MPTQPSVLDLGCGNDKIPGAFGIDVNPNSAADLIRSLDDTPWPLEESSITQVRAQDVLEHVHDFLKVVDEIYRVCRDGARIEVRMPFMSSANYATDPTHKRASTHRSFDYFDPTKHLSCYGYSKSRFKIEQFKYERGYVGTVGQIFKQLDRAVVPWLERNADVYEQYFAYLYPMHNVSYTLRVEK